MATQAEDPVVDEIRAARRMISERFENDPERLVQHYVELQKAYQERLVEAPESLEPLGQPVA